MKSGKVWGSTCQVMANHACEFHRIEVRKGGFCSKHIHRHKFNGFFVESGELKVSVVKLSQGLTDKTVLGPGDFMVVAPGDEHWFEADGPVVAFELYWAPVLDGSDITRKSSGGNRESDGR